jgi:predicted transcriptional regulator
MAKRDRGQTAPERLAWFGRVIGHPLRVQILQVLERHGQSTAGQLAQELGEPLETVAYHVRLLHEADALELISERVTHGARERTFAIKPDVRDQLKDLPGFLQ